ncbi:putative ABC transport system ATP-binding protein [Sporobacter termitidis DSM 10068]|uniref:Putative ABC transport system ATP-binding protein n=1 Tax=Sporobacter termitidis DSM 10068 TaxID=1123282 RepID=A0A1M5YTP9_9FIRM|nr:ABC transporter ATP-binding protein [Sporobacter termitidis]SHI15200.1 putative ABC transport system ATP-binding protein [Sporobacter termitidis DSM 10068]
MLICINDVYKIYGEGLENEVRALNGVSLEIDYGEYVSIIGTSGSGKSTLMNILGCLDVPTRGAYLLDDISVRELSDNDLSRIRSLKVGFIFQGYNLIPTLTAYENVELPMIYQGVPAGQRRAAILEALERVDMTGRMGHHPSELSGGQQQRVAIARAIATKAPIIMADEPTGALDSKTGAQIMDTLSELNKTGSTVILITHDLAISKRANRIVQLKDGKIVGDKVKEELAQ